MKPHIVIVMIEVEARTPGIASAIVRNLVLREPLTKAKSIKQIVVQPVREAK